MFFLTIFVHGEIILSIRTKKTRAKISLDSRLTNNLKGRKASLMPQSEHRERAHTPKARSRDLKPFTG